MVCSHTPNMILIKPLIHCLNARIKLNSLGFLLLTCINLWASNYINYKDWVKLLISTPDFNAVTFEVWEWISNVWVRRMISTVLRIWPYIHTLFSNCISESINVPLCAHLFGNSGRKLPFGPLRRSDHFCKRMIVDRINTTGMWNMISSPATPTVCLEQKYDNFKSRDVTFSMPSPSQKYLYLR